MSLLAAGAPLAHARAVAIMVHGRGGSAADILGLGEALGLDDVAYLAPQAEDHSWYPYSFLAPLERNEPLLSNALATLAAAVDACGRHGFAPERVALIGFSQGGCLALEYAARNAQRFGAVAGLSAGLIGPPGMARNYAGSLAGTPVFLGCSDVDAHLPLARVHETRDALTALGGAVTERIYPGMPHTVNDDEVAHVSRLLAGIGATAAA
jgi:phospholipase/carboxylesterase